MKAVLKISSFLFGVSVVGYAVVSLRRSNPKVPLVGFDDNVSFERRVEIGKSTDFERLSELSEGGRVSEEKTRLMVVGILEGLFEEKDLNGLAELDRSLSEIRLNGSFVLIGGDFMRGVPISGCRDAIVFLSNLKSYLGYDLMIGATAEAIVGSSDVGFDAYSEISRDFSDLGVKLNAGVFSEKVWGRVGESLVTAEGDRNVKEVLSKAASASERRSFLWGVSSGLRGVVGSGDSLRVGRIFDLLDQVDRVDLSVNLASSTFEVNESNLAAFQKLLSLMERTGGVDTDGYSRLGRGMEETAFNATFLNRGEEPLTEEMAGVVKGWVAQRPKSSVERFYEAGETEILRPGFQAWMEVDSIEASAWLQTMSAGPQRDVCIEELCGYLAGKGAEEEAKAWLSELPAEAQQRLKEKYEFK